MPLRVEDRTLGQIAEPDAMDCVPSCTCEHISRPVPANRAERRRKREWTGTLIRAVRDSACPVHKENT